jgi:hypothetical protein
VGINGLGAEGLYFGRVQLARNRIDISAERYFVGVLESGIVILDNIIYSPG